MGSSSTLVLDFARRMVDDLATNNVLRGSWAEQLVAHFLGVESLPENWSYYDLLDANGRRISVKNSVGSRPSFSVSMSTWAWEPDKGWLDGSGETARYWCEAYVFAWLEAASSAPPLDVVLDADLWRFGVVGRTQMMEAFVAGRATPQKTSGLSTLSTLTDFVPGVELGGLLGEVPVVGNLTTPATRSQQESRELGVPVRVVADEVVPETTVPSPDP